MIRGWVLAWKEKTGKLPSESSGEIPDSHGETWCAVNSALCFGLRGLRGGLSLSKFIYSELGVRTRTGKPDLSIDIIISWISDWHQSTGRYPCLNSGEIPGSGGETWMIVGAALYTGGRGLPGGLTLAKIIADRFGVRNQTNLPSLSVSIVREMVKEWKKQKGEFPRSDSGEIPGSNGETWGSIDSALYNGCRGLPGGSSLPRFLAEHFGVRNRANLPQITIAMLKRQIEEYREREGSWPVKTSGEIPDSGGDTWSVINRALKKGIRGLPGGTCLARFIIEHFPDSPHAKCLRSRQSSPAKSDPPKPRRPKPKPNPDPEPKDRPDARRSRR